MIEAETRIVAAREAVSAKLAELRRRESEARTSLAPLRYLASPWLRVGIAAVLGYRIGRPRTVGASPATMPREPTVLQAVLRASVISIAQALVQHALTRPTSEAR